MPFRRRPEINDSNPVRLRRDQLEVLLDPFSGYELSVRAHSKAELILGRRDLRPQQHRPCTDGERDGGDSRELHASDDIKGIRAEGPGWASGSCLCAFQTRYRRSEMRRGVVPEL